VRCFTSMGRGREADSGWRMADSSEKNAGGVFFSDYPLSAIRHPLPVFSKLFGSAFTNTENVRIVRMAAAAAQMACFFMTRLPY
jgi:hypothetical protein